jgi:polyhydroxyalkanoate synthesis regulator phasin
MGSVMAAGRGADSKEEYYLRTLLALAQQAQAANERGRGSNAQELVVDAIGAFVDKGEMDGDAGERFVKHLHRRTREEEARGNGTNAEIMGFIDTVLISKIVDRLARQGPKDRPVTLPKWLRGSLAGSMRFNEAMKSGGAQSARVAASEITRIVDEQESDEDEMQIPVIP